MATATTKAHVEEQVPPGKSTSMEQHMLDKGTQMLQSLKPIKQMNQHVCTFTMYSHDMSRQIETHHYVTRVNQDFLQCAVYDSDESTGRLIGVEYIISDRIFEALPQEEQKLWHSHAHEIKSGLWVNPRVPEMVVRLELENLSKTFDKFWCTWQTDRGIVKIGLVKKRDDKYGISTDAIKTARVDLPEPTHLNPQADYWVEHGKGFSIYVEDVEMKKRPPFP